MKYISALLLIFIGCLEVHAQNFIGDEKEIAKILENNKLFSTYVVASDYDKIAGSYTTDGKMMPGGKDIIEGFEDIKKGWILPEGLSTLRHEIKPVEIKIIDDHAYDYGYYSGATKRADGTEVTWKGKYVVVWKKVGDNWKIYLDIWNPIN